MGDHSSAYIFGRVFELIAADVPPRKRKMAARKFWKMSHEFDFTESEMHAEKALAKLGLARERIPDEYPEDGACWHYGPPGNDSP